MTVIAVSLSALLWQAYPSLLPIGSGPDLAHHLALVDYIERHSAPVHGANRSFELGEMAYYAPGLHALVAVIATAIGTSGLFVIYPVVALSVALKFGIFAMIVARMAADWRLHTPLTVGGLALLGCAHSLTIDSFARESYLAQVVSELFALGMLWALVAWTERGSAATMVVFGVAGAAAFLTWPMWIGPLIVALLLAIVTTRTHPVQTRAIHFAIAITPIAIVAALHTAGRFAPRRSSPRAALLQHRLWRGSDGGCRCSRYREPCSRRDTGHNEPSFSRCWDSPSKQPRSRFWRCARCRHAVHGHQDGVPGGVPTGSGGAGHHCRREQRRDRVGLCRGGYNSRRRATARGTASSTNRLCRAVCRGGWARTHLPRDCVDYLVGNEYTAYWLHIAVLRNPRLSARSSNDDLYRTETAFARWVDDGALRYGIAKRSVLPAEVRERTRPLFTSGDAAVIERISSMPAAAVGTCDASQGRASP